MRNFPIKLQIQEHMAHRMRADVVDGKSRRREKKKRRSSTRKKMMMMMMMIKMLMGKRTVTRLTAMLETRMTKMMTENITLELKKTRMMTLRRRRQSLMKVNSLRKSCG